MVGEPGHIGDVLLGGSGVLGGDVLTVERLDQLGEVAQRQASVVGVRSAVGHGRDHSLAAAELQPRDGCLEGHGPRQPLHVENRVVR